MSDCPVQCPRQDGRACGKCSADIAIGAASSHSAEVSPSVFRSHTRSTHRREDKQAMSELRLRGVDPSRRGVGASVRAAPYVSVVGGV